MKALSKYEPGQFTHRILKLSENTFKSFLMKELSMSQTVCVTHSSSLGKNGQVRLCIDYRRLKLQTIKNAYSLPKIEDTFSSLNGSQRFYVLDLKSGYYQIEVEEADKPKAALVCPPGFWKLNRMPQGETNAPSTFQRLMDFKVT